MVLGTPEVALQLFPPNEAGFEAPPLLATNTAALRCSLLPKPAKPREIGLFPDMACHSGRAGNVQPLPVRLLSCNLCALGARMVLLDGKRCIMAYHRLALKLDEGLPGCQCFHRGVRLYM